MFYRLFVILLISFNLLSPEKANAQEPKICPCGFVTWDGVCPPCLQYKDGDGDGYGDPLVFINWDGGTLASGYVANKDDCNDKDNTIYPRAPELCDGKDNDCDLQVDEGFTDTDADGMADCIDPDDDNDGVADDLDCDDNNPNITTAQTWVLDYDNDGYYIGEPVNACTSPGEGYKIKVNQLEEDCEDGDASINPGAEEIDCDGIDNNCDGYDDGNCVECTGPTYYRDSDGDGFGNPNDFTAPVCDLSQVPDGYVENNLDCNDGDVDINPNTIWYKDADNDGYSDGTTKTQCTQPDDYKLASVFSGKPLDCDDSNADIHGGATWYLDADGDGYAASKTAACTSPGANYTTTVLPLGDCNDANAEINPATIWYQDRDNDGYSNLYKVTGCERPSIYYGTWPFGGYTQGKLASELNSLDFDCNDNDRYIYPRTWYKDADNDGFSDGTREVSCYQPSGYKPEGGVVPGGDCNDADNAINPNTKWYPDFDNDRYSTGNYIVQCARPEGGKLPRELNSTIGDCDDNNATLNPNTTWYKDADDDGYREVNSMWKTQCLRPIGYKLYSELTFGDDCDDTNPVLNSATVWYKDADEDGYGSGDILVQCTRPSLYKLATELASTFGDCSDLNASVNPGAVEICRNGIDDNCNGVTDEGTCEQCKNATALTTTNITANSATLEWSAITNPEQWQVQFKTNKKGSKWIDVFVTGNKRSVTISSLLSDQNYSWQIRAKCGKSWTDYSTAVAFKTTGIVSSVEARVSPIDESSTFEVITAPNPSDSYFTLTVKSSNTTDRISVRVMDELGRVVDQRENVMQGTTVRFGDKFVPGIYFVFVQQGNNSKSVKLIRR